MATVRENKVEIDNIEKRCDEERGRIEKEFETVWEAINSLRNRGNLILSGVLVSAFGVIATLIIKIVEMANGS